VTAANEYTLLTLLVNTVVIGNYTMPNVGVSVPGILAPATVNGTKVNLLPYFSGGLASSNRGGSSGVSINFLDGGGAAPLMKNMPADSMTSNQYFLLTHLYQFFGALLGCTKQGMPGFDAYMGQASMYEVHKFMDLSYAEVTYFIEQVGMAAASFGVATADITAVATALETVFNVKCGPPTTLIKSEGPELESICIDPATCPLAVNATCDKYATPMKPKPANSTTMPTTVAPTGVMPTGSSMPSSVPTAAAAVNGWSLAAVAVGLAAFAL